MIKEAIDKLVKGQNLDFEQAKICFEEIFDHKATPSQTAAFLVALSLKKETEDEISAAAGVVREHAKKVNIRDSFLGIEIEDEYIMDTCGTGGSGLNKFNISTAVAFVAAACGIKVAKHGNKAMSSTCGSADVLEALGVKVDAPLGVMEEAIKTVGIGFLYAPLYHPALKEVALIRREVGIRTIFNILGPLCNPAFATHQLLGVHSKELVGIIARVLKNLGLKRALVVHGKDLKDEVSLTGKTDAAFLNNNKIKMFSLNPSDFGLKKIKLDDLLAKDAKTSAAMVRDVLGGKKGAPRDVVLANSSCCLYILGKAKTFKEGVKLSAQLIEEGKALKKLDDFKNFLDEKS